MSFQQHSAPKRKHQHHMFSIFNGTHRLLLFVLLAFPHRARAVQTRSRSYEGQLRIGNNQQPESGGFLADGMAHGSGSCWGGVGDLGIGKWRTVTKSYRAPCVASSLLCLCVVKIFLNKRQAASWVCCCRGWC